MRLLNRNRSSWLLAALATTACLNAQQTNSASSAGFSVYTSVPGAQFTVDGQPYTSAATFNWPVGSRHIVAFVANNIPDTSLISTGSSATLSVLQYSQNADTAYAFNSWTDNTGLLNDGNNPVQIITADPSVTWLKATVTVNYRVVLNFFDIPPATMPATCDASVAPTTGFRVGLVLIGSQCYWNNTILYAPANQQLTLNAFPYPGFVFLGWSSNLGSNSFLTSWNLTGPVTLAPRFSPAKRVHFETNPPGLQVLVDRTAVPTLTVQPDSSAICPSNQSLPVSVPAGFPQLCRGDFDFAPGSTHVIGAPSPQIDANGGLWVFDSWGNGQGENAVYKADNQTSTPDTVIVKFVPGAQVSFVTNPGRLKLEVDGRTNWPAYNFVWGVGTTHQVSAPLQESDNAGRKYTFRSWSNGGSAAQSVTVDQTAAGNGLRMIASYDVLSRVVLQTSPPGQTVQVDGVACETPCKVDRANGASVQISAPASIPVSSTVRMDFAGWSDGGSSTHTYTLGSDLQTLTATYNMMYQLATGSDPANGANYTLDPVSPDGFYTGNSQVNVSVEGKPGFRFRRWAGDLSGTYPAGTLSMTGAHAVVAMFD
ncbi:MAG: hypothetical protein JO022_13390, partial [Acidobacteriaceae bacterium]|nr:hypothetical protein [Acidobacteriaceae bacterium]